MLPPIVYIVRCEPLNTEQYVLDPSDPVAKVVYLAVIKIMELISKETGES